MRILLIEDDSELAEIMEAMLVEEGFEVEKLAPTLDVLQKVANRHSDLVIVDYILPEINGGELCAQIKKSPRSRDIPVILMTGYSRVLLSLGEYGYDEMIEKPFDRDHFIARVNHYLKQES